MHVVATPETPITNYVKMAHSPNFPVILYAHCQSAENAYNATHHLS